MKSYTQGLLAALMLFSLFEAGTPDARAQGTAFTYQGWLSAGSGSANGSYDLTFALYPVSSGGAPVSVPVTNVAVAVTNGLFTTTIDFGPGIFSGSAYWLEIAVATNGSGVFTTLSPRQSVKPSPYAIYAGEAGILTGNISLSQLPSVVVTNNATNASLNGSFGGTFAGTGAGVTVNGAPVLTTASAPLGISILTNSSGAPDVIEGSMENFVGTGVLGGTIGGGGSTNYFGIVYTNSVQGNFGTVGGGGGNTAALYSTVSGGFYNTASGESATIAGGGGNTASNSFATVSGGSLNVAGAGFAVVPGGQQNQALGSYSFAAGYQAQATNTGAFVWADAVGSAFTSTSNNQFNV